MRVIPLLLLSIASVLSSVPGELPLTGTDLSSSNPNDSSDVNPSSNELNDVSPNGNDEEKPLSEGSDADPTDMDTPEETNKSDESDESGKSNESGTESSDESGSSTTDACVEAMSSLCNLGEQYSFEDSLRCLEDHVRELQGACSIALNVMMSNLYSDCSDSVESLCHSATSSCEKDDESVYVLTCLSNHESELNADCQQQLDMYLSQEYPCTKEAAQFCSRDSGSSPEHTLSCLENIAVVSSDEISAECFSVLHQFSSCKNEDHGDEADPKPKPGATSRYLASVSDNDKTDMKPKPKPKPNPKPKPKPGGEDGQRRCWQGLGSIGKSSEDGSETFFNSFGDVLESSSQTDSNVTHTSGIVLSSLIVVLALIAVVGVKYRQSQENIDSRGGYWRAPSIQAMMYDDSSQSSPSYGDSSSHSFMQDRPIIGQVVEMEDLAKTPPKLKPCVNAVQVSLSPIPSDEIRV